jgi:sigma-B regulation protein RsbU (phosphoserine phosphatase)
MASLPPVRLGFNLFISFAAALALRKPLEKRFVLPADQALQPGRQLRLDLLLILAAGLLAAAQNTFFHHFPLGSAGSLLYGVLIYGFFIALDTALARERTVIRSALAEQGPQRPPPRLYSITRRFALVAAATALFISIVFVSVIARDMVWLTRVGDDPAAQSAAVLSVAYELLFILAVVLALAINLILSYSRNLKLLFENQTGVLERVSNGDLSRMVPVATRDEFGVIAGHTNAMIDALRHRIQLLGALKLAEEVQRNLLPAGPPAVPGLELSGTSIYCYETGGDYYDYILLPAGRLGIVVADAAGHGVDAALYMISARAFLLAAAKQFEDPARLVRDINRHLTPDSAASGRFMSLFFLEIDPASHTLRWVRGGHEPAVVYSPTTEGFGELGGEGMALGVVEEFDFKHYRRQGWDPGTVVVIGTDGITETRSPSGKLFGQARLRQVIREHAAEPAEAIQAAVIAAVEGFRAEAPQEDDVTLVVLKLLE